MKVLHFRAVTGLLLFLIAGCGNQSAPPVAPNSGAPVLKVAVSADGRLTVDGSTATIQSLQTSLRSLREREGLVLYYREAGQQEPPPIAMDVMKAVAAARLPVQLSSRPDYSDYIDERGQPISMKQR